jgi:hypothetical protein
MTTAKEELAKLKAELRGVKARVAELKHAAAPKPAAPFVEQPWTPYDPTARMSMPASAMREMANAIPDRVVHDIAMRDGRAPTGPSSAGVVPSSQQISNVRGNVAGGGTGWSREIPLSPPPGIHLVDAQLIADDVRQRMAKK